MDALLQLLYADDLLSQRAVVRLVLLSGLFTVICIRVFPNNAPSRRAFLLAGVALLVILPWLLMSNALVWSLPVQALPTYNLSGNLPNLVVLLWLSGAALLCARHLVAANQELRAIAQLPIAEDERVITELRAVSAQLDIVVPSLHIGDAAYSTTLGRSRVVLPSHWHQWDQATLRSVLLHECIHIRRLDDRWLLLTRLLVLSYWWMPWLILVYRHYVRAMEESCDDLASEYLGHEVTYVGALAHAAGVDGSSAQTRVNVAGMHEHHLVGRIGRFASQRTIELDTPSIYWWLICILIMVVGLTSIQPVLVTTDLRLEAQAGPRLLPPVSSTGPLATYPEVSEHISFGGSLPTSQVARYLQPEQSALAIYPGQAIRQGWEGHVTVEFTVNADGSISNPEVLEGSQHTVFHESALRAVARTRYATEAHTAQAYPNTPQRIARSTAHVEPVRIRRTFVFRLDRR